MTTIDDIALAIRMRQNVLETLNLWSSKEKQFEYQEKVPIAQVSAELFCMWSDDFYQPDQDWFEMAFDKIEREILDDFDKLLTHVCDKSDFDLPYITDFVNTNDWILLNRAAIETLQRINNRSIDKG